MNGTPVDFRSETIRYLMKDMNKNMNLLLKSIDEMGVSDGKLTLTLNVHLEESDVDAGHIAPFFKHKIKSGFNLSHETDGFLDGDYFLTRDSEGNYQISEIDYQLD